MTTITTPGRWPMLRGAVLLTGLAVAGVALLTWSLTTIALIPLFAGAALATRKLASARRRWVTTMTGVTIGESYDPLPEHGWWQRFRVTWADPATWRDLRWLAIDGTVGVALRLASVTLFLAGLLGLALPLVWTQLPESAALDFPFGQRVTDVMSAVVVSMPWGAAYLLGWFVLSPWLTRLDVRLNGWLLRPGERARLSRRVEQLAASRAHGIDERASELRRIERDLHDGAQAHLVALGMSLGLAEQMLAGDPRASKLIAEAREHNAQAIAELRSLIQGIRPPVLSDRGLDGAVRSLAMRIPLQISLDLEVPGRLPEPVESAAYFSIAELLSNVVKHANATSATVRVRHDGQRLLLSVTDDGSGGAIPAQGTGLQGIRERLAAFDGTVRIGAGPGGGTEVAAEIPCLAPVTQS
jgi:signal transduction histidine kinase